jgi:uncharacterized protein YjdB
MRIPRPPYNPSYLVGDLGQLKVTAFNGSNAAFAVDYTLRMVYASSNPSVATVDEKTAMIKALAPGTTTITATYTWKFGSRSETIVKPIVVTVTSPQA